MSELTSNDLQIAALAPKGQTVTGQSHILQALTAKSASSKQELQHNLIELGNKAEGGK